MNNHLRIEDLLNTGSPRFSPERRMPHLFGLGGSSGGLGISMDGMPDVLGTQGAEYGNEYSAEAAAMYEALAELARKQYANYEKYFLPQITGYLEDPVGPNGESQFALDKQEERELQVLRGDIRGNELAALREDANVTPERLEAAAAASNADVEGAYTRAIAEETERNRSMGLNPGSGRAAALNRQMGVQKAGSRAGAQYTARKDTRDTARRIQAGLSGVGIQPPQAGMAQMTYQQGAGLPATAMQGTSSAAGGMGFLAGQQYGREKEAMDRLFNWASVAAKGGEIRNAPVVPLKRGGLPVQYLAEGTEPEKRGARRATGTILGIGTVGNDPRYQALVRERILPSIRGSVETAQELRERLPMLGDYTDAQIESLKAYANEQSASAGEYARGLPGRVPDMPGRLPTDVEMERGAGEVYRRAKSGVDATGDIARRNLPDVDVSREAQGAIEGAKRVGQAGREAAEGIDYPNIDVPREAEGVKSAFNKMLPEYPNLDVPRETQGGIEAGRSFGQGAKEAVQRNLPAIDVEKGVEKLAEVGQGAIEAGRTIGQGAKDIAARNLPQAMPSAAEFTQVLEKAVPGVNVPAMAGLGAVLGPAAWLYSTKGVLAPDNPADYRSMAQYNAEVHGRAAGGAAPVAHFEGGGDTAMMLAPWGALGAAVAAAMGVPLPLKQGGLPRYAGGLGPVMNSEDHPYGPSIDYRLGAGQVDGPGTETSDSVPAMLSDKEFVFDEDSARFYGTDKLYKMMEQAHKKIAERGGTPSTGLPYQEDYQQDYVGQGDTPQPRGNPSASPQMAHGGAVRHYAGGGPGDPQYDYEAGYKTWEEVMREAGLYDAKGEGTGAPYSSSQVASPGIEAPGGDPYRAQAVYAPTSYEDLIDAQKSPITMRVDPLMVEPLGVARGGVPVRRMAIGGLSGLFGFGRSPAPQNQSGTSISSYPQFWDRGPLPPTVARPAPLPGDARPLQPAAGDFYQRLKDIQAEQYATPLDRLAVEGGLRPLQPTAAQQYDRIREIARQPTAAQPRVKPVAGISPLSSTQQGVPGPGLVSTQQGVPGPRVKPATQAKIRLGGQGARRRGFVSPVKPPTVPPGAEAQPKPTYAPLAAERNQDRGERPQKLF